jgi:hypothetical protein
MALVIRLERFWVGLESLLAHAAAVVIGLIMMVVGLGLGVSMIMLPVGVVVGLLGVGVVTAGLFAHIDEHRV